ncbi:MAG: ImmA/IrrE family metallo-endopeptidase [Defluviitaleaceae bacterium]|nr:ImmA/IrrE family metallo-endopeptidase [Defluviitaleaceae bacterium]
MTNERRQAINDFAGKIRELFAVATDEPIGKFGDIVARLGGRIEETSKDYLYEQVVKKSSESFTIYLDKTGAYSSEQQRFTTAHELGHLLIHMGYGTKNWDSVNIGDNYNKVLGIYSIVEEEADEFAAAFLMPEEGFIKVAKESSNDIEEIAKHFNVAVIDAKKRGRCLGIWGR